MSSVIPLVFGVFIFWEWIFLLTIKFLSVLSMFAGEAEMRRGRSNYAIQYKRRDQSPNNYKKKLQTGWELCDREHKGVEFWVSNKRKRSHSSLFACGCTSMKSIQALLSNRASHYLKLLIINDLNIISWEETIIALRTQPLPPAWISKLFTTGEGWFF